MLPLYFKRFFAGFCLIIILKAAAYPTGINAQNALVLQSDFGIADGAVASMKGVAFGVSPDLRIFDLTHQISPYNIWEAAYRLEQTALFWPPGTVFVSVVDPGVGTSRRSIVLKTHTGHYFITPDNGTLTLVLESLGIDAVREIDESTHRLEGSEQSYTFHGRDIYAFTGAKLASGAITFEEIGPLFSSPLIKLEQPAPAYSNKGKVTGFIPILDIQYGNVWTNINRDLFGKMEVQHGEKLLVTIHRNGQIHYQGSVPFVYTFGDVGPGKPLLYLNSLGNLSIALNMENFAETFSIQPGPDWIFTAQKIP